MEEERKRKTAERGLRESPARRAAQDWKLVGSGRRSAGWRLTGAAEHRGGQQSTPGRHGCEAFPAPKSEAVGWARERWHGRMGAAG